MLSVRCKNCGKELEAHPTKSRCCGCPNMTTLKSDKISAVDLSLVVMITNNQSNKRKSVLSSEDLQYQEERRRRKVRRIDFEER
jgi:hypothetical protein